MAMARVCLHSAVTHLLRRASLITNPSVLLVRGVRYQYASYERVMKMRRKFAGPTRLYKRSEWQDWNYESELFAFPKRLQEEVSESTLKIAFTHPSYITAEEKRRTELGIPLQDVPLNLIPNTHLVDLGSDVMSSYLKAYVRHGYPKIPEEGIIAIHDYLMSDPILAHVSSNIGTKDLILTEEFPVSENTFSDTLKAFVGAIATDCSQERAELFTADFVCPQLIGKDILDIWKIKDPMCVLNEMLHSHGRALTESRLVFESGRNTLESIFVVAVYSEKQFLGKGPGETIAAAEEMAAQNVLRIIFGLTPSDMPLPFGKQVRNMQLDKTNEHVKLAQFQSELLVNKNCGLT